MCAQFADPVAGVGMLCRQLYNDVAALQREGSVAARTVAQFVPGDARRGTITSPYALLTPAQLAIAYPAAHWLPALRSYMAEMQSRPLRTLSLDDLFLFTDGPAHNLTVDVSLNGRALTSVALRDVNKDMFFRLSTVRGAHCCWRWW